MLTIRGRSTLINTDPAFTIPGPTDGAANRVRGSLSYSTNPRTFVNDITGTMPGGITCRAVDAASVTIASDDIECQLATLHCGELLGIAEACLERTQRYLKERTQFGDVIGRNQSLKHIAADDLMRTESMRLATEYAAWAHEAWRDNELSRGEFELAIDVMRVLAPSSGRKVVEDAIQLHGGVGFTWELGLHLPLRRALRLGASLGAIHDNRERIAGRMFGDNATAAISPIGAAAD